MENKINLIASQTKAGIIYNLEPIGIGTPFVECLTGYIERIADAHCLSVSELFKGLIFPKIDKHYTNIIAKEGGGGFYDWAHTLNGLGKSAIEFISVLEQLTMRKDVGSLTMIKFKHVIPQRGLLKNHKSWCSSCYQEMHSHGVVYEQLNWMIKSNAICPIHQIKLENRCPSCHKYIKTLDRRSRPGYCSNCSQWLGKCINECAATIVSWDLRKAVMLSEMLNSNYDNCLLKDNVARSIRAIAEFYTGGNYNALAKKMNVPKATFWGWSSGKHLPTLEDVLRLCSQLSILPSFIYQGLVKNIFPDVIYSKRICSSGNFNPNLNLIVIKKELQLIVDSPDLNGLPVKRIAKKLKCCKKTLYKYWGDLCRLQSRKNKKYKSVKRDIRHMYLLGEIMRSIGENSPETVTFNQIETQLNRPALFRERRIKIFWKTFVTKLPDNVKTD